MSSERLRQVEKSLTRFRDQLAGKEDALTTIAPEERVRIKQQITDLKAEMRPFEEEYWQILANESATTAISEPVPEVEIVVAEIIKQAGQLQTSQEYSDEVLEWLQQIHAEVSKPGEPAAAKLKGVLSLLPPFVNLSYEAELDTEPFLQRHFPTFRRWSKALAKKS
jgi:DNA repair exonuclease SbcCD ATPase subunit